MASGFDADAAVRYALCACLLYTATATTTACDLVLLCVGFMGDSDSESDFELHTVHTVEDGFSDPPSDVPSEEPATEDDVEIGSDTDGADGAEKAFGQLGYTWGHGEVVSLRSLPDYKFDPDEAFADVCVTGADGAGAAPSAAVAHASSSVSNVKRQTTITAFFK